MTPMYAVIDAGGKQERVQVGELVDVELLDAAPGDELRLRPLLVVDGTDVVATATALASARVTATVIGETKGPKIDGFTYKAKTRQRRRFGHRQRYTTLEITAIEGPAAPSKTASRSRAKSPAKPAATVETAEVAVAAEPAASEVAADAQPAAAAETAEAVAGTKTTTKAKRPTKAETSAATTAAVAGEAPAAVAAAAAETAPAAESAETEATAEAATTEPAPRAKRRTKTETATSASPVSETAED